MVLAKYVCQPGATVANKRRTSYAASGNKRETVAGCTWHKMGRRPSSAGWASSSAQIHAIDRSIAVNTSVTNPVIGKMHSQPIARVLLTLYHTVLAGRRFCVRFRRSLGLLAKIRYRTVPNLAVQDSTVAIHARSGVIRVSVHLVYRLYR